MPGDALRAVNVYVIRLDRERIALLDTGPWHRQSIAALDEALASLETSVEQISIVIATHAHYDHLGLGARIRSLSGAELLLGEREVGLLEVALTPGTYQRSVEHRRRWLGQHDARGVLDAVERIEQNGQFAAMSGAGRWEPPDRLLSDGEEVVVGDRTLRAVWTPGHTRGHLVFVDAGNGLLFAGDHVLPHITPSLGFEPFADGRALERFLQSLGAVRDLPVQRVLPGHGPVFGDLAGRVDELLAHHRTRLERCVAVVSDHGASSAHAVASQLPWTRWEQPFSDLDALNRMLAVTETVTHLELLVERGCLIRDGDDRVRYSLAA
jgi:glyoxylase-like metal-dependent hydrolase (beta-lactamase superfamily II)